MIRSVLAIAVIAGVATAAFAQSDPVKKRQDMMKENEAGATVLFRMTRGEVMAQFYQQPGAPAAG